MAALSMSRTFFRAYELCRGNGLPAENGVPNALVPSIVCIAFSTELALKALLLVEGKESRKHELNELFDGLSSDHRARVLQESCITEASFHANLDAVATTFVDWRYLHERPGVQSSNEVFLATLHRAVNTVAQQAVERIRASGR